MLLYEDDGHTCTGGTSKTAQFPQIGFEFRPCGFEVTSEFLKAREFADSMGDSKRFTELTNQFVSERVLSWWSYDPSGERATIKIKKNKDSEAVEIKPDLEGVKKMPHPIIIQIVDVLCGYSPPVDLPDLKTSAMNLGESLKN